MATNTPNRTVSRTYRAAIRLGEDFVTLEETVTLPLDANDEEVAQAIDLGWRIYRAQAAAVAEQASGIRAGMPAMPSVRMADPDVPASDKQRNFIATLRDQLGWTSEQLAAYAEDQNVDLATLTKGQASAFIDGLKRLRDAPAESPVSSQGAVRGGQAELDQASALRPIACVGRTASAGVTTGEDLPF
jgi:hypothetical protein